MNRRRACEGLSVRGSGGEPRWPIPHPSASHQYRVYVSDFRIHAGAKGQSRQCPGSNEFWPPERCRIEIRKCQEAPGSRAKRYMTSNMIRIKLIEIRMATARRTSHTVVADGFNSHGGMHRSTAARSRGLALVTPAAQYLTLRDTKGTGQADERKILHTPGLRRPCIFCRPRLHGLKMGPDGKTFSARRCGAST